MRGINKMKTALIATFRIYQKTISPLLPHSCRFSPTCSEYMITAIEKHGTVKGLYKGATRIMRCHPFNPGGYDPA